MQPAVLEPQLDVGRRVEDLPLHDQRRAVVGHPGGSRSSHGTSRWTPVGQHLQPAALGEVGRAVRTMCRRPRRPGARSRGRPAASPVAGEITNGGLVVIRSNVSSATGSKKQPARTSMFGDVVEGRVELRHPQRRAALMSVATTASAWVARCSAWTPHPVPRSRARPTGSRSVSWASEVAAGLMPSTWSVGDPDGRPVEAGVRSLTTQRSMSVGGVRADVEQRAYLAAGRTRAKPGVLELADQPGQGPLGVLGRRPPPGGGTAGSGWRAASRRAYAAGPGWSRCGRAPRGRGCRAGRRRRRR